MTAVGDNVRINSARLWDSLMEMAKIGPGVAGGNNRQTLTDADAEGRALFKTWCDAAGLTMGVDTMGNMFATRAGEDLKALPVYIGSHLDTQPTGGKFDGILGVLAGLEVIRTMNDLGIRTKHPVVVTNWTNEEGARFAPAMLASGVFAGIHTEDYAKARTDLDGKVFGEELQRIGWVGDEKVGARKMHAMFEYHIEQGPILEAEGKEIGVVTHGQGLWWLEITLTGDVKREAGASDNGMVMDFADVKALANEHLVSVWDHAFIVYEGDATVRDFLASLTDHKTVVLDCIPTVENLAAVAFKILAGVFDAHYGQDLRLTHLRLYETPNCWADVHA